MEKPKVMAQIQANSDEQVMHGDFPGAVQDAAIETLDIQNKLSSDLLTDPIKMNQMTLLVLAQIRD